MKIGELAERTGVSVATLRFYENEGLLSSVRGKGRYRYFAEAAVTEVCRIRNFRSLELSLPAIRQLLHWSSTPAESCLEVCQLMRVQLQRVQDKKRELERLEAELSHWIEVCPGGRGESCQILKAASLPSS